MVFLKVDKISNDSKKISYLNTSSTISFRTTMNLPFIFLHFYTDLSAYCVDVSYDVTTPDAIGQADDKIFCDLIFLIQKVNCNKTIKKETLV